MKSDNLITIFCTIDDFCIQFEPEWNATLLTPKTGKRERKGSLILSKIMTILTPVRREKIKNSNQNT
jgi:hypothetical protein